MKVGIGKLRRQEGGGGNKKLLKASEKGVSRAAVIETALSIFLKKKHYSEEGEQGSLETDVEYTRSLVPLAVVWQTEI